MDLLNWLRNQWDRVAAVTCVLLGAVLVFLGWLGASGSTLAARQIPYVISGGIGGLFLLGLGAALWITGDLHDEWLVLDEIRTNRPRPIRLDDDHPQLEPVTTGDVEADGGRSAAAGARR